MSNDINDFVENYDETVFESIQVLGAGYQLDKRVALDVLGYTHEKEKKDVVNPSTGKIVDRTHWRLKDGSPCQLIPFSSDNNIAVILTKLIKHTYTIDYDSKNEKFILLSKVYDGIKFEGVSLAEVICKIAVYDAYISGGE